MRDPRKLPVAPAALLTATISSLLAPTGSPRAQQLEQIIVTAERRETDLQETPISVMSFDMETLELAGVDDLFEVANLTPNLDIKGARGVGNTSPIYEIRGISGGGGATGERSVGFYIDNVFMPRTTGPVMRVLDVERLEVLRGPQGTLFGRNSTGGAIRVFSQQPSAERDGYLKLTGGNFDHLDIAGMVNVPLTDEIFLRAQGAYLSQEGFVERGPQMLGSSEDSVARLQLGWNPSDTLSMTFGALYTDSESDGSPTELNEFNMLLPQNCPSGDVCWQGNYADWVSDFLAANGQPRLTEDDPRLVLDDYTMPDWCFLEDANPDWDELCRQWNDSDYTQVDANVSWDVFDNVTMVSTTGISSFESSGVSDWQLLGMEFRPSNVESDVIYQEVQFNFPLGDERVDFVTGLSYFQEDSGSPREALYNAVGSSTFVPATGGTANGDLWGCNTSQGVTPCDPAGPPTNAARMRVTGDGSTEQEATSYGVFANATIHLGQIVNLTLGVRESYDEKEISSTLYRNDSFVPVSGNETTVTAKDDWSATDWRATLDFQIMDDFMLYLTRSQAFRSGTFSILAPTCPVAPCPPNANLRPQPGAVPPETLLNEEIGFRSEWFNGRFRFNATYYELEYTDRQGASAVPDATSPTGFTIQLTNQGNVDLWGAEMEAMFAVTERFTLEAAAGTANYKMANPCVNNGPYLFPPPMDEEWSLSGRYDLQAQRGNYTIALVYVDSGTMQTHPGGFTPEEQATFGCSAFAASFIDSRYQMPGYELLNAALRFTTDSGKWTTTLFVNNLTDEVYANNGQSFGRGFWTAGGPPGIQGPFAAPRNAIADYRGRPREYGLSFQYNFF